MQLVVEAACVAHRIAVVVASPQSCDGRVTIGALEAGSGSIRRLFQTIKSHE